jgi:nucleotidyltransferase/DNA polymerase involved in DNA repair
VTAPVGDRTILHVDLDAFFAAVEQRDHPEWRGKPLAVGMGGTNDRGVVSAASYEARKFGVHSAMPIRTAKRLCPDCIFVPVRGAAYQAASREVMAILRRFTPLVEPISIDEAFLDVTGSRRLFGDGAAIARSIKNAVRAEQELTASVGVATTKLVAKIASDLRKPDGLVVVEPGTEAEFLAPLPISRLWGVGASTAAALRDFSVVTIGDLAAVDRSALVRRFGRHGASLVDRAHGVDPDPVDNPDAAKSVSHEMTFDEDTADIDVLERTLLAMSEGVSGRLPARRAQGRHGHRQDPRQRVPHDHAPAGTRRAVGHDGVDLAGCPRARPARDAREADPAARRGGVGVRVARAARPVRGRGRAAPEGHRGGGRAPRAVRDAGRHARTAVAHGRACAVRARLRELRRAPRRPRRGPRADGAEASQGH